MPELNTADARGHFPRLEEIFITASEEREGRSWHGFMILGRPGERFSRKTGAGFCTGQAQEKGAARHKTLQAVRFGALGELGMVLGLTQIPVPDPGPVPAPGLTLPPLPLPEEGTQRDGRKCRVREEA
ncbi:hypothetical protein KM043_005284 [Ampulex compressa]|nr:hypothetical protein KM043_005284 [Ampulex compressa]